MSDWRRRLEELTRDGDDDQLLTASEAAKMLGVTDLTVTRYGRQGKLPRVKLGTRTIRYRLGDIRQMIREATER